MKMPSANSAIIDAKDSIVRALAAIVPDGIIADSSGLQVFDSDAFNLYRECPLVCVLPRTRQQVQDVVRFARREGIPLVPRGAGTSLSGGALPRADGILLGLGRMNKIIEVDYENCCVVTQPGVTNRNITKAVEAAGFYYAPDPSSQIACSIGGNIAENSGGLHCLKYGLTTNNVLGVVFITPDGEEVRIGGKCGAQGGLDLLGIITGSEGLLGVVVEATVKILRKPPSTRTLLGGFPTVRLAAQVIANIISDGLVPAAMEFMDRQCADAVEAFNAPGYPRDAEAILIIDADGVSTDVADTAARIIAIIEGCGGTVIEAKDEDQRARLWSGRKAAFSATGRIKPDMFCMDGTIPRKTLPDVMDGLADLSRQYNLACCNVFHAGDGNLHPLIMFDAMNPGELERAESFGADILRLCVKVGGVLSGEHGIGIEKRDLMPIMFSQAELEQQGRLKCAFDPQGLFNPGKVFPVLSPCIEQGHLHVRGAALPHPHLPRF